MKKFIFILFVVFSTNLWASNTVKTVNVPYSLDDFSFTYDTDGYLKISTSSLCSYSEKNEPGLPLLPYEITLDGQYSYVSSNVKYEKKLIKSNVVVRQSPLPVATDGSMSVPMSNAITYPETVFPDTNFMYSMQSRWSDLSIFRFLVCPFIYDAKEKNLYFIESFDVEVTASMYSGQTNTRRLRKSPSIMRSKKGLSERKAESGIIKSADNNGASADIEYVIITADSLKQSFEPLMNWKRTKGLKSKIITIEEIYSSYPGSRNSVKLKNCLYDLYANRGLVYVLLGGDDKIIPVQGCYCRVKKDSTSYYVDYNIPSDIFYSCYDGDFEWDGNGNGIYGEVDDNINFTQYVYVTRVPIRKNIDIVSFVSKLLKYEQSPDWSNKMLMCGTKLWRNIKNSTQSDAEAKGDNLYTNYIKPYWNGKRYRFYDTLTDFSGGKEYDLTNVNLSNQLSNGYDIVDMMTHGGQTTWSMEKGLSYSSSDGSTQTNIRSSIITTMACNTNAFDTSSYPGSSDPCLSESLIRNPSSGVIAYLGCSRYGWGYGGDDNNGGTSQMGPSLKYESYFYRFLLSKSYSDLNYGVLVSAAKNSYIASSNRYDSYRWLQLGLNPIGDPEMPIFIEQPQAFKNVKFDHKANELIIKTGVEGCKICIMSASDNGNTYHKVYDAVDNITIEQFPSSYSVCITKQGYIPLVYNISHESNKWIIQNQKMIGLAAYSLDNMEFGSNVTQNLPNGNVEVNSGTTEITAKSVILRPGFSVKKGAEFKIKNK